MKRKKLLSTAVAGMLVAAQMVMPVAATSDGSFTVDVKTISPIINVVVPTSLRIAVNEFEKDDMGSQIYSKAFTMRNKSEVPVKVKVVSTQSKADSADTLATLTATKKGVEGVQADTKTAWLATVAQVAATAANGAEKYIAETGKALKDLTESNANVVTFDTTDRNATQSFYLKAPSATMAYKAIIVEDDNGDSNKANQVTARSNAEKVSYAKFYKMVEATDITDGATLTAAVEKEDIYKIKDANTVVRYSKGTTTTFTDNDATQNADIGLFKMGDVTEARDITSSDDDGVKTIYVYGEYTGTAVAGDSAGFRYIGKLSEASSAWVAKDIGKISIAYDIDGIAEDRYNSVSGFCEYGYFKSLAGKTTNGTSVMNDAATPTAFGTKQAIAGRLRNTTNNKVQFVLTPNQRATIKAEGLTVKKITYVVSGSGTGESAVAPREEPIEVTSAMVSVAASPAANTDGKLYAITPANSSVTSIDYIVVEYGKTDVASMIVKYTFAAQ